MMREERIVYFDHLRIFAAFLIMLLHAAAYKWNELDVGSLYWNILNVWKALTDHAVLLYVMISGALFLGRDIPIKKLYLKYILRLLAAYIIWTVAYCAYTDGSSGLWYFGFSLFYGHYHLWFLLMLICLYMCVPIFNAIIRSEKLLRYFLLLSFIFSFLLPTLFNLSDTFAPGWINACMKGLHDRMTEMHMYTVCGYSFFFLLGYYLNKEYSRAKRIQGRAEAIIYILGILAIPVTAILSSVDSAASKTPSDIYHGNFNIAVLLTLTATFIFFMNHLSSVPKCMPASLPARLSEYSFGAYLVHDFILLLLDRIFHLNAVSFFPLLAVPVIGIITFIISFAISAGLNSIPFAKRFLV